MSAPRRGGGPAPEAGRGKPSGACWRRSTHGDDGRELRRRADGRRSDRRLPPGAAAGRRRDAGGCSRSSTRRLGRRAAMKTLAAAHAAHPSAIKRLFIEALAVNRINNPHIVEVTDLVEARRSRTAPAAHAATAPVPPVNAIVMELLEGQSLAQADGRATGRMEPESLPADPGAGLPRAGGGARRGLRASRSQARQHLPRRSRAARDFVKLLDFGLTKAFAQPAPGMSGTPIARRRWTASSWARRPTSRRSRPRAAPVDHRTDIYAVGVILYELICGRLPFEGPSVGEFLIQHVTTPAPPLPPERARDQARARRWTRSFSAVWRRIRRRASRRRRELARMFDDLARGGRRRVHRHRKLPCGSGTVAARPRTRRGDPGDRRADPGAAAGAGRGRWAGPPPLRRAPAGTARAPHLSHVDVTPPPAPRRTPPPR